MRRQFTLFYTFNGNKHRHSFIAEDLAEAKLKAQWLVDRWNRSIGFGRVLEWVEEGSEQT